jgi:SOS-response transcriptional repressor LexA
MSRKILEKSNILVENIDFSGQIKLLMKGLGLNQTSLAIKLGLSQGVISEFASGAREPSKEFLLGLPRIGVSLDWFLTGEGEMFFVKNDKKHPFIVELEAIVDKKLEKIETQIAEIEGQLKKKGIDNPDSGLYVLEPEPEYGDGRVKTPFVDDIAAGPPIQQSEDLSGYINVPKRFIKTKPEDYYAARIRGESMTAAGIPDGCTVLIRRSDVPRDGAIQVVRNEGRSTLKRMREGEDHTWTLHYEDNSKWSIAIGKDEDYQVQGDFVTVLPEDK